MCKMCEDVGGALNLGILHIFLVILPMILSNFMMSSLNNGTA